MYEIAVHARNGTKKKGKAAEGRGCREGWRCGYHAR